MAEAAALKLNDRFLLPMEPAMAVRISARALASPSSISTSLLPPFLKNELQRADRSPERISPEDTGVPEAAVTLCSCTTEKENWRRRLKLLELQVSNTLSLKWPPKHVSIMMTKVMAINVTVTALEFVDIDEKLLCHFINSTGTQTEN